jgi:hypothetical protein
VKVAREELVVIALGGSVPTNEAMPHPILFSNSDLLNPSVWSEVAATTFYVAGTVILSGCVSGIVALGILQIYGREAIQRRVVTSFFSDLYELLPLAEGNPVICRLYYRQVAGHFLSIANNEAFQAAEQQNAPSEELSMGDSRRARNTPLLHFLECRSRRGGKYAKDGRWDERRRLENAVQQIDELQALLGDAVSRSVMFRMIGVWIIFYLLVVSFAEIPRHIYLPFDKPWYEVVAFVAASVVWPVFSIAASVALSIASSAVGLVTFSWLDRFVSTK